MEFQLEPQPKWLPFVEPPPSRIDVGSQSNIQPILDALKTRTALDGFNGEYIIPLGTGSAIPARFRNVSATWVHHRAGSLLLDAGEGTLGQLDRRFGVDLETQLASLKLVFISHMHGDHLLGTASVVKAWREARNRKDAKLYIVAPSLAWKWLQTMESLEGGPNDDLRFVDCERLRVIKNSVEILEPLYRDLELAYFQAVDVPHCQLSFGCVVQFSSGFKVSYSGDCRPSKNLADAGIGSDLLIHEATLPDCLLADAVKKRHSTFSEAIKAKNILLTHFSQRFAKFNYVPVDPLCASTVGVAVDLMKIPMGSFNKLPLLNDPRLTKYFGEEEEEDSEPQVD
ncbi:hypothetical protein HDU91_003536 [Kappamyces sp. JEL0680]|nr:hypothetical protein HDU91_003536 [Kappamyces sp. JEL0680]